MKPLKSPLLLVEDDALVARSVARVLACEGLMVIVARTYAEGLSLTQHFGIGVFDIDLPDGNGVELAERLLERGSVERAVFFTASADSELLFRAERVGTLVLKTRGLDELFRAITSSGNAGWPGASRDVRLPARAVGDGLQDSAPISGARKR
jgi:DNA-binding NarL/FixJ family response regulator